MKTVTNACLLVLLALVAASVATAQPGLATIIPGTTACFADGRNPTCYIQHPERFTDNMSMNIRAACFNGYNPSRAESITTYCTTFPVYNTMFGYSDPGIILPPFNWVMQAGSVHILASSIGGIWPATGDTGEDCYGVPYGNGFSYAPC